jgi:hypothetical protein
MTFPYQQQNSSSLELPHTYLSLFIAEGDSEVGFISQALEKSMADKDKNLVYCLKGLSHDLGSKMKVLSSRSGWSLVKNIFFMLDAETNFNARLSQIVNCLPQIGFPGAAADFASGFGLAVNTVSGRSTGIFISPGASAKGRIEDLIVGEIQLQPEWKCLTEFDACFTKQFGQSLDTKGLVQCYISWKKGDLCGVGRAFQVGIFDTGSTVYTNPRKIVAGLVS